MKKSVAMLAGLIVSIGMVFPKAGEAYNFGDFRSETLTTKAWGSLNEGDIEAVLAYTNKCMELYAAEAKKMQGSLTDYAGESKEEVFSYWALNDVATSLFIQGEAYRRAKMPDEAVEAYQKIVKEYSFGQAWDTNGWFWKPAEAAKDKIKIIESGADIDFGDYTSSFLATQAWKALADNDIEGVLTYVNKVVEMYSEKGSEMQEALTEYPWQSKDKIFEYWALNDVGTAFYIKGEALKKDGKLKESKDAYQRLIDEFYYAQCWDPSGWFWKPAEAAQKAIEDLGEV